MTSPPRAAPIALLLLALGACGKSGDAPSSSGPAGTHPNEVRGESTSARKPPLSGQTPVRGDTAVLSLLADVGSFNPYLAQSVDDSEIHDMIFPRLMEEQPDYYKGPPTFKPLLAESWEPGADGISIRFTLRDTKWSDGTPVTAEDVRFSWEAAKNPDVAWVSASIVDFIRDVEVHGPREFTVHYTEKYPYQLMDINDMRIIPRHVFGKIPFEQWQSHGEWQDQAKVCSGPWRLESYKRNQEISFGPNPTYWDKSKPYLNRVVFRVFGDMQTLLNAVLAGDVDFARSVQPEQTQRVLDAGHLNLYSYVTRVAGWIGWNCRRAPFDDVRVRNAMTHALNRENIVESIFYGYATVAAPVMIRSMWASNHAIEPLAFDPERASALLDEAGWKRTGEAVRAKDGKPFRFTLVTNKGNTIRQKICEFAQSNLRQIGVDVNVDLMDFNQMSQQLKQHKFDAYVGGLSSATKVDGMAVWHSSAAEGRFNYPAYSNKRVDEIIEKARTMFDQAAAKPLWDELQEIMNKDQPYTMLYEPRGLVAIPKRFQDVEVTSLRALWNLEEWWVPKDQQKYP